jgi:hypothetical protein
MGAWALVGMLAPSTNTVRESVTTAMLWGRDDACREATTASRAGIGHADDFRGRRGGPRGRVHWRAGIDGDGGGRRSSGMEDI